MALGEMFPGRSLESAFAFKSTQLPWSFGSQASRRAADIAPGPSGSFPLIPIDPSRTAAIGTNADAVCKGGGSRWQSASATLRRGPPQFSDNRRPRPEGAGDLRQADRGRRTGSAEFRSPGSEAVRPKLGRVRRRSTHWTRYWPVPVRRSGGTPPATSRKFRQRFGQQVRSASPSDMREQKISCAS